MRLLSRLLVTSPCLIVACVIICSGQVVEGVHGNVFRNKAIGLTYTLPAGLSPKVENEIRPQDPSGREHIILALWSAPERTGVPRIAFLYDRKIRPAGWSREEMASRYLDAIRQMWANVRGVKISGPTKISPAGYAVWRLDIWQPDNVPHFNSAIAIPLIDHRIVVIQINAPSQNELDAEVDSLRGLQLDGM